MTHILSDFLWFSKKFSLKSSINALKKKKNLFKQILLFYFFSLKMISFL